MWPVESPETSQLRIVNYTVDEEGSLQAYEYTEPEPEVQDVSKYGGFMAESCGVVVERG
jgi:hypothetical protein